MLLPLPHCFTLLFSNKKGHERSGKGHAFFTNTNSLKLHFIVPTNKVKVKLTNARKVKMVEIVPENVMMKTKQTNVER